VFIRNHRFLALEIPDEVVDELQALMFGRQSWVYDVVVTWRPVSRP
jgi:hypothetical protein